MTNFSIKTPFDTDSKKQIWIPNIFKGRVTISKFFIIYLKIYAVNKTKFFKFQ